MFPELDEERKFIPEPEAVIKKRINKLINQETTEYLIKWRNWPVEDATWEDDFFIQTCPQLSKH